MLKDEYIYQEIQEQLRLIKIHQNAPRISIPKVKGRTIITGAGDSYCASEFGEWILKDKYNVIALPAMDALQYSAIGYKLVARNLFPFVVPTLVGLIEPAKAGTTNKYIPDKRVRATKLTKNDVVIGISVSGLTNRIIEIFKLAKKVGAYSIAITDNANSPASQLADETWLTYASPQEELKHSSYKLKEAKEYIGYHHDVAQTKTFWAVLLTLLRASQIKFDWKCLNKNTKKLLSEKFYKPILNKADIWAKAKQTFFLSTHPFSIISRFATYKIYEYNLIAHFTEMEEYCHTQYFITRKNDNVVFLCHNDLTLKRALEIIPTIQKLFSANIILIKPQNLTTQIESDCLKTLFIPIKPRLLHDKTVRNDASGVSLRGTLVTKQSRFCDFLNNRIENDCSKKGLTIIEIPATKNPIIQFFEMVIAVEWLTYLIGRINAKNINTFHAGFNTEELVKGSYYTIRKTSLIN